MRQVYLVRDNSAMKDMFLNDPKKRWVITHKLLTADLVQFGGGSDINPQWYNEDRHPKTFFDPDWDAKERIAFNLAQKRNIPVAGICRGAQLLNVLCGGKIWQHVDGHKGNHIAWDLFTGESFVVTSTHHQMMICGVDGLVVLSSKEATVKEGFANNKIRVFATRSKKHEDIEAIYYAEDQAYCFQTHPEYREK